MKLFKSHLSIILVIAMLIASFGFTAYAQDKTIDASINYENSTVTVTYVSPLDYDTYVSIYVVPASNAEKLTDFTKVVCMEQVVCKAKSPVVAEIIFDASQMDGFYDVFAVPGGVDSSKGYIKLANAFKVYGKTNEATLLSEVNSKTKDTIGTAIASFLKDTLKLENEDCPQWKSEILYQIKTEDYNGAYTSVSHLIDSWYLSDVIYTINCAKNADDLTLALENKDDNILFDVENEYYTKFKSSFAASYFPNKANVTSKTSALRIFNEILTITGFNNCDVEGKAGVISKYISVLGLYDQEKLINDVTPAAIARLLYDKTYTNVVDLKIDILAKITELQNAKPDKPQSGSSGSGSGSGSGGSGGGSNIVLPVPQPSVAPVSKFTDIPHTHWANTAIETLAERNIINGYDDNTFKANNTVTREEFVKMAVIAFNVEKGDNAIKEFNDVKSTFWAKSYIDIAVSAGVINGVNDTSFGVAKPVTRQDAAVIIARILKLTNSEGKVFADDNKIAHYAKQAVAAMSSAGIINGYQDGTFKPESMLSRAEAAQIIYNALSK